MNLAAIIEDHPADRPALVGAGTTTYGQLRDWVAAARGGLLARGVTAGDRVAIVAGNDEHFVIAYLAVLGVGAVAVPLNPASPAPEMQRDLEEVGARLVVVAPTARGAVAGVDLDAVVSPDGMVTTDDLDGGAGADLVDRRPDDLAVLLFTSGTVGAPRAAMLTHGNLLANVEQILASPGSLGADDVVLGLLPLFHVFGLNAVLAVGLRAGVPVVLVDRFDPGDTLARIAEHGVTVVTGVPTMWSALAGLAEVGPDALAGVRLAVSGAAPLDPGVGRLVGERLGVALAQGYGLTEASPVVTSAAGTDAPAGSVGVPLPGVAVRLVDAQDDDVLVGDPGEIRVGGPNVFAGYWNDPEATTAALGHDRWLRTGDVGVVDEAGFLYLVDRIKDLIIVSGFNVFPAEVEEVIATHPSVAAAAVVGVPHPRSGEAVRAFVVAEPGATVDEDAIVELCRRRLARYKCPSRVTFVDALPEGMSGKVLRRSLR